MRPRHVPLSAKLGVIVLTFGTLIVGIGFLAVEMSRTIQRSSRAILEENVSSLKAAQELELALLDQKGLVGSYLLEGDRRWLDILGDKQQNFDQWLKKALDVALIPDEHRILNDIRALYRQYDKARLKVITLYEQGDRPAAQQLLLNDVRALVDRLYQLCEELLFLNEQIIAESQEASERRVGWLRAVVWSIIAVAIVAGLLAGLLLARGVTRRLMQSEHLSALGQMAGIVAHEVRNPLTAIRMRLHSLQEESGLSVSGRDDLQVISQEIGRLERLAKDFLSFARLPEPRMAPVDLTLVLSEALSVLQPMRGTKPILVEREGSEALPVVRGDAEQLKQVLLNVLLNAIQAAGPGAVGVVLRGRRGPRQEGREVEVVVWDEGPGISPEVRERLFEPFVTTKAQGTGLGLSLAKRIVEQHGGRVEVGARREGGTEVSVSLPAAEERSRRAAATVAGGAPDKSRAQGVGA